MSTSAPGFAAGQLTPHELEQGSRSLESAREAVLRSTQGLSEAQWHYRPAADRWSIAEILEHIVVVQDRVLGPLWDQLVTAPPPPAGHDSKVVAALILTETPNRSEKFPAPEPVRPAARWTPAAALERFLANDAKLRERLESTRDLHQHAVPSMPLKAISKGAHELMDGYEWILLVAGHSERHTLQIREVIADPNFPRS